MLSGENCCILIGMWRSWKFWVILLVIVAIGVVTIGYFAGGGAGINTANPPQFIQHDFIDLSKIGSVSKYRSGAGHNYAANGETCRSMKHYYMPIIDPDDDWRLNSSDGLPPPPDGKTDIPIYSPVDGQIVSVKEDQTNIGIQAWIQPKNAPAFKIRLFHIFLSEGINEGSKVRAGQQIGVIGGQQMTDIAVESFAPWKKQAVPYFQVMPDSLFQAYLDRGATSRDDFVISQAKRDANPLQCDGEKFIYPNNYDHNLDEFHLTGYKLPRDGSWN